MDINNAYNFAKWLETELEDFVALIEEGSVAAGDSFQPGFSDHDLNVVVERNTDRAVLAMSDYLEEHQLGDEYLVSPRLHSEFVVGNTLNDLSLKFRAKIITGSDVIAEKSKPSRSAALHAGITGLEGLMPRFERRWLNLSHWDLNYAQHKNYELFKNFFVFAAAVHYGKTGYYPKTRYEMSQLLPDKEVGEAMFKVVNDIANASKEDQRRAFTLAREYIPHWIS